MENNTQPVEKKSSGFKTAIIIILTFLSAYGLANLEVLRRARAAYLRGEDFYAKKQYKQAMWSYQEVQEFYYMPHSHWVDDAAEKEWICRAQLGDFIPTEGPLDADVRNTRPDYAKYKAEIAQITPTGDITFEPAPPTAEEKKRMSKMGTKK
jgi:hypothetical protein